MKYNEIWAGLRKELGDENSIITRGIAPDGAHDFDLMLSGAEEYKSLLATFKLDEMPESLKLPIAQGFELKKFERPVATHKGRLSLELKVTSSMFEDLFDDLVTNVVESANQHKDPLSGLRAFLSRLDLWKRFASRVPESGLSRSHQIGLYGELWVMRELLMPVLAPETVIEMWQGPDFATQDFQLRGLALEVKTTTHKGSEHLTISSEKQLDPGPWDNLLLTHVAADMNNGAGEVLPAMVKSVRAIVAQGPSGGAFFDKLLEYGYADAHEDKYKSYGFNVRKSRSYLVAKNFPSILPKDIATGIGNVSYSIDVSACGPYLSAPGKLQELLGAL